MWYYAENGERQGPLSELELRDRLADGRLSPDTLIWRQGMADWVPLGQTDLAEHGAPGPPPANWLWQAITVLVLNVLACAISWCTGIVGLTLSIVAVVFACLVDGAWARGDHGSARNYAMTAKICTIIAAVMLLVQVAIMVGFVVMMLVAEHMQ